MGNRHKTLWTPAAGDVVGEKYRLLRQLGQGGMGIVYEAVHEGLGKHVAIKILHPEEADNETVARFHQEAHAAAAVGHRGIVDVYDFGVEKDGSPFLVMEMLRGHSLDDRIGAEGELDIPTAAFVGTQVLSALGAVHGAGIIHRDLKPENIYLVDSGAVLPDVKILDFGISRVVGTQARDEATRMTKTGIVMGTPFYMSPEQCAGKRDVDLRADLFAMGVILYECLTGVLPFDEDNYNALIMKIVSDEPDPPRTHRADLPVELEALVLRALSKDRGERHQDAQEMFRALLPFVESGIQSMIPPPPESGAVRKVDLEVSLPPANLFTDTDREGMTSTSDAAARAAARDAEGTTPRLVATVEVDSDDLPAGEVETTGDLSQFRTERDAPAPPSASAPAQPALQSGDEPEIGAASSAAGHRPLIMLIVIILSLLVGGGVALVIAGDRASPSEDRAVSPTTPLIEEGTAEDSSQELAGALGPSFEDEARSASGADASHEIESDGASPATVEIEADSLGAPGLSPERGAHRSGRHSKRPIEPRTPSSDDRGAAREDEGFRPVRTDSPAELPPPAPALRPRGDGFYPVGVGPTSGDEPSGREADD